MPWPPGWGPIRDNVGGLIRQVSKLQKTRSWWKRSTEMGNAFGVPGVELRLFVASALPALGSFFFCSFLPVF